MSFMSRISAQPGPEGRIAIVMASDEGRVSGHLIGPAQALALAKDLLELAGSPEGHCIDGAGPSRPAESPNSRIDA